MYLIVVCFLILIGCNNHGASGDITTTTPEEQGLNSEVLVDMLEYTKEINKEIHSIIIYRNDALVTEAYFYPYSKDVKHNIFSCTKSILSGLVGIAIEEEIIKGVDEKVVDFFPEFKIENMDHHKERMTVEHLLTMTTGLDWVDTFQYGSPNESTTKMDSSPNAVNFALNQPIVDEPGTTFYYNNGASQILSAIIQKETMLSTFEYASLRMFDPLRIHDVVWFPNQNGISNGSGGILMTPRDMGKIGLLYLNNGQWNGEQIVPLEWVQTSASNLIDTTGPWPSRSGYGYQWWMNSFGGYSARGFGGQYIFVVPEYDLVVVFTGSLENRDTSIPEMMMERFIIPAIESDRALKENMQANEELKTILKEIENPNHPLDVPDLPTIAHNVSGREYVFEQNVLGLEAFTFTFEQNSEATLHVRYLGYDYKFDVGLDDVYRLYDMDQGIIGPLSIYNMMAAKGYWQDEKSFIVDWKHGFQDILTFTFEEDEVTLMSQGLKITGK